MKLVSESYQAFKSISFFSFSIILLMAIFIATEVRAQSYVDWTSTSTFDGPNGTTGTLGRTENVIQNGTGGIFSQGIGIGTFSDVAPSDQAYFTPSISGADERLNDSIFSTAQGKITYTVTFSQAISNPQFHFTI